MLRVELFFPSVIHSCRPGTGAYRGPSVVPAVASGRTWDACFRESGTAAHRGDEPIQERSCVFQPVQNAFQSAWPSVQDGVALDLEIADADQKMNAVRHDHHDRHDAADDRLCDASALSVCEDVPHDHCVHDNVPPEGGVAARCPYARASPRRGLFHEIDVLHATLVALQNCVLGRLG